MKPNRWKLRPLRECARMRSGGTPSKANEGYWSGEIPWVSSGEMAEHRIYDTELKITEEAAHEGSRLVPAGTVLFVVRGMSLAKEFRVALTMRQVAFNQDLKALECADDVDAGFLFYALLARKEYIRDLATEASHGTKKLESAVLDAVEIPMPARDEQERVSSFFATYDDLIDNNRRRIKLLEDSVRLLFDEWFVRQQLPPHLESRLDEEPLHLSVADLCIEVKVQVLPEAIDADTPYIGLEHMPRRAIALSDWGAANDVTSAKLRYIEGDIIFGKIRPYFHKVGIALTDGVCSSDAIVMRPRAERSRPLLLALVSSDAFIAATAQGMKEGSKMPRADWKQMRAYSVCVPNPRVLSAFNGVVEPVLQQVKTLALQARALRTARDLLLPRLMSGELAV